MFSFDPSTTNTILTVAVVGLFIFFITILIKLKSSKESTETLTEAERQKLTHPSPIGQENPLPPKPTNVETPKIADKPLVAVGPSVGGSSVQAEGATPTPAPTSFRQPEKTVTTAPAPTKKGFAPTRNDCPHHFGYLHTFPKNSPIPDECFGCEKIIDCLVLTEKMKGGEKRVAPSQRRNDQKHHNRRS